MGRYLAKADSLGLTLAKAEGVRPINRERKAARLAFRAIKALWRDAFRAEAASLAAQLPAARAERAKLDNEAIVAQVMRALVFDPNLSLVDAMAAALEALAVDAVAQGFRQVMNGTPTDAVMLSLTNERAVAWARDRAAELVGMKRNAAGDLVPNGAWAIPETTRERVRELVTRAEDEGWSNDRLARALREDYAFSAARAEMIARTETAFADVEGNLLAYRASGMVRGKRWVLANLGDKACCEACRVASRAGTLPFDAAFPGVARLAPPAHPNCRCDVLPILADDED